MNSEDNTLTELARNWNACQKRRRRRKADPITAAFEDNLGLEGDDIEGWE